MPGPGLDELLEIVSNPDFSAAGDRGRSGSGGGRGGANTDPSTPEGVANIIRQAFLAAGFSQEQADFAVEVARRESSLLTNQPPTPELSESGSLLGYSHGIFQLFDGGLLGDFYTQGYNDPNDPREAAEYAAQYIKQALSSGQSWQQAWEPWHASHDLFGQGIDPLDAAKLGLEAELGRGNLAARYAELGLGRDRLGAEVAQNRFGNELAIQQFLESQHDSMFQRAKDKLALLQTTDALADARRSDAVNFFLQALPNLIPQGFQEMLGGASSALGASLGIGTIGQPGLQAPEATLPLADFLDAPRTVTPGRIQRELPATRSPVRRQDLPRSP